MIGVFAMALAILTSAAAPAKAAEEFGNGNAQPSQIEVTWETPGKLLHIEQGQTECVLTVELAGGQTALSLSFPDCGGIRLHTDKPGYFEPETLLPIAYEQAEQTLALTQETARAVISTEGDWSVALQNAAGETIHTLDADKLRFGYQNGELKKVMLLGAISEEERLFGLGERFNAFDQVGQEVLLWNQDSYQGLMRYDGNKTWGYKNVPLLYSSKGYSLFFNSTYAANADIGSADSAVYSLDFNGPKFDVYFWLGTPQENLVSYTALTGRTVVPPKWALEFSVGAGGQVWDALGKGKHIDVMTNVLEQYDRLGTPVVSLFGEQSPQYDAQAYQLLKNRGTRMIAWYWSAMGVGDMYQYDYSLTADTVPTVVLKSDPTKIMQGEYIDFSNPTSVDVISGFFSKLWGWGLRGCMVDFGDNIFEDSFFHNGMTGDEMHNFYAYLYNKGYYEAWSKALGEDYILFSRSGCAGSQRWMGQFAGDHPSTFQGLQQAIRGGLSASTAGFSLWGSDIGGYGYDEYPPTPDCYMRWMQFGTFSPLMRTHGTSDRNPWSYGEQAEKVYQEHYWLRENLLDLIYSGAISASRSGVSMIQPLYLAYPDQPELIDIEDQYLFCGVFLACPVVREEAYCREVTFPAGNDWIDLWTGEVVSGGQTLTVAAPQERMPVYVKAGAAFPVKVSQKTLALTDSMSEGAADALLVAAGTGSTPFFADKETQTQFDTALDSGLLTVQNPGDCAQRVLLAYGLRADAVRVDGKALDKLDAPSAQTAGYYNDVTRDVTVVTLPEGAWQTVTLEAGDHTENLAAGKTATASSQRNDKVAAEKATDGLVKTAWEPKHAKDEWLAVDLGQTQEISNVTVRWTQEFASDYAVELSTDGEHWQAAAAVSGGHGGAEALAFNPAQARYVRVRITAEPEGKRVGIYEVQVYAGGTYLGDAEMPDVAPLKARTPWGWIAGGAAAVLAAGAALLFLRKKKKTPQQ